MIIHPNFDPVAFQLGPLSVHWYGLTYLLGFATVYLLGSYRIKQHSYLAKAGWTTEQISDLIFYAALGAVIGGRLGYVLFYKPAEYLADPLQILFLNQGGMSFHGGLLGVIVAIVLFAKKTQHSFLEIGDFVVPLAAPGIGFVRLSNFINQELWGKTTDLPWGVVFHNGGPLPRHPSQLYEAALEGLVLFLVVWWLAKKRRKLGFLSGVFLVGYALARMFVEFFRVPDAHLDYIFLDWVTMGQLLSLPLLIVGLYLIFRSNKQ